MINITISAKSLKNRIEYIFEAEIDSLNSVFVFKPNLFTYPIETQDLDNLIRNYNENYGAGEFIEFRELYKTFELNKKSRIERDIARIFIITSAWIHFSFINLEDRNIFINHINESKKTFLDDRNIYEWNGDTGTQPGVYFIKKEYITQHHEAILKLYNLGLLYKYELTIDQCNYENYLFPFVKSYEANIASVKNYEILPFRNVFNKIINDRNIEMKKFINGTRI